MGFMDIVEIRRLVLEHFKGDRDKTAQWMGTQNPLLGQISPEDMVRLHREDKLLSFVKTQLAENHGQD